MNLPAIQKTQLPAHLQHLAGNQQLMALNQAASAGISSGGWPRISIKGSRFRLQHPQGEEVVVPTVDLDIIIVDANPHGISKIYYAGAYDPTVEEKAPDCYSDNGVGPSARASKPQCGTCAACPHNVWGSKINPSGSSTKACSDVKKVAVLIAANPEGPVFELRIPPASLKNWGTYIDSLNSRGIPAGAIVTKLKFDTNADFPKLLFEASGWSTEEQARVVMEVIGTEEVDQCTGRNDKPIDATKALSALSQPAVGPTPPPNLAYPHVGMPPVAQPAVIAAPPLLPRAPMPPVAQQAAPLPPVAPPVATQAVEAAPPAVPKRTRKAKEFTPASPSGEVGTPPPFLGGPPAAPPTAAAQAAPLVPAGVTNSALDDLIAQAMKV